MTERDHLIEGLNQVRGLERSFRSPRTAPTETILIGGAGVTGRQYGSFFTQAGLPVCSVLDISPKNEAVSLGALGDAEYNQLSDPFDIQTVKVALRRHPGAAIYVMTPQGTHTQWLEALAPVILEHGTSLAMEKPLAMSVQDARNIINLINRHPELAHLAMAGSYTTFKAAALLGLFGAIDKNSPVLDDIKPLDDETPDFQTYLDGFDSAQLGGLKDIRCLFMEGRKGTREVIGTYGRTHLALYPGGGMTGDLLEHPLDPLVRLGVIDPDSQFSRVYLGYTPVGEAATSFPWQVPDKQGLAEMEGELTFYGSSNIPVLVTYGKRGPEFIGDVRRTRLIFSNGTTMEVGYVTSTGGRSNIFTINHLGEKPHSYYLNQDPYVSMLQQYRGLWGGSLQGEGGLYIQLVNACMIGDIYSTWREQEPTLFQRSAKFREQKGKNLPEYQENQNRDYRAITNLPTSKKL